MQAILWHQNYSIFNFLSVSNHWTRRGKLQKCDYLDNEYNKYLKNKIKIKIKSICHNF